MDYETWEQVEIPSDFVQILRTLQSQDDFLWCLVSLKIFKEKFRYSYKYTCNKCGRNKVLNRIYEDYSNCYSCHSRKITLSPAINFTSYDGEQNDNFISKLINKMQANYSMYYKKNTPENFLNIETTATHFDIKNPNFKTFKFKSKFICGEEITESSPILSLTKACLLCPFLWDDSFDWKNKYKMDKGRRSHITPLLYLYSVHNHGNNPIYGVGNYDNFEEDDE